MARFFSVSTLLLVLWPYTAFAGVFVSEIAWMGTEVSASNEWIELANDGNQSVSLDGWTLKAKDGSPSIPLSGVISSQGYFLIERTDDESVPNIPADLVTSFGKGLSNVGETLDLKDANGTIVDTVKGGKDWKAIGGDPKTKFTAQKRGSVWVTAKATPRSAPPLPPPPAPAPVVPEKIIPSTPKKMLPKEVFQSAVEKSDPMQKDVIQKVYGGDSVVPREEPQKTSTTLPLLGTLLLIGVGGVMYVREKTKSEAERYTIIEDDGE